MNRLITAFAVGVATLTLLTACGSQGTRSARQPAASSHPSTSGQAFTIASQGRSVTTARGRVPVTVQSNAQMRAAGNAGPSSSILHPTSCTVTAKTATARGTEGRPADVYDRYGDRIDLYVFSARQRGFPAGIQVAAKPFTNKAPAVYRGWSRVARSWKVTAPLIPGLARHYRPVRCMVAAQPTYDFQGAP